MYNEANVGEVNYRLECVPQEGAAGNGDEFPGARVPTEGVVRIECWKVQVSKCDGENEDSVCERHDTNIPIDSQNKTRC